ncbi:MAG: S8 family peptidase [Dehalococcoidia bacterium]|nr:S8 family peptidase [Dehalococcoidia bacterium]
MKRALGFCLVLVLLAYGVPQALAQSNGDSSRLIVVFKPGVGADEQMRIVRSHGAAPIKPLSLVNATVVTASDSSTRARLLSDATVVRVDDDTIMTASDRPEISSQGKPQPNQPTQQLPWGIDRIDADRAWASTTGAGIKVGIVDTGVDLDHADLKANIKGGINTINPRKSYNDDNGHGTHVAGTVAAISNTIGVVGGAPAANLYGIKVLGASGSGYLSDVIEGLDWAIQNHMQVINMSLGSASDNSSLHDAVSRVYQAGIIQVVAAGNSSGPVGYPAAYSEVIAVSAIDINGGFASFSNFGAEVDLTAPGVGIYSTYNNGLYATMSGTSMATPHVTSVAALVLAAKGTMTPDQMLAHLKLTASSLAGLTTPQQGAGMVNAYAAVQ